MKLLKKEINEKGHAVITCQSSILFGLIKKEVRFIATEQYPKGYWNWMRMSDGILVEDRLSYQLDAWWGS